MVTKNLPKWKLLKIAWAGQKFICRQADQCTDELCRVIGGTDSKSGMTKWEKNGLVSHVLSPAKRSLKFCGAFTDGHWKRFKKRRENLWFTGILSFPFLCGVYQRCASKCNTPEKMRKFVGDIGAGLVSPVAQHIYNVVMNYDYPLCTHLLQINTNRPITVLSHFARKIYELTTTKLCVSFVC